MPRPAGPPRVHVAGAARAARRRTARSGADEPMRTGRDERSRDRATGRPSRRFVAEPTPHQPGLGEVSESGCAPAASVSRARARRTRTVRIPLDSLRKAAGSVRAATSSSASVVIAGGNGATPLRALQAGGQRPSRSRSTTATAAAAGPRSSAARSPRASRNGELLAPRSRRRNPGNPAPRRSGRAPRSATRTPCRRIVDRHLVSDPATGLPLRPGLGRYARGSSNENVEPSPGCDSTAILPPIRSTSSRQT